MCQSFFNGLDLILIFYEKEKDSEIRCEQLKRLHYTHTYIYINSTNQVLRIYALSLLLALPNAVIM